MLATHMAVVVLDTLTKNTAVGTVVGPAPVSDDTLVTWDHPVSGDPVTLRFRDNRSITGRFVLLAH